MIVNVAGAGAGKTTSMADILLAHDIPDGKVIFCIAFTNAAADNIRDKVSLKTGNVPEKIKISTIHSFLYQELIKPYYYFLYGKHFKQLSTISLPSNSRYKATKLSELENADILHITKIPEKAKWVAFKKSGDNKKIKDVRQRILSNFTDYCAAIYVDEAQDISEDISIVLHSLESAGIEINLYGDPKQDVKGFGCFRDIIDNTENVHYITECYRCPQIHLNLSNTLATGNEKQVADSKNANGSLDIVFESSIDDIKKFVASRDYELCYISKKQKSFNTHNSKYNDTRFALLHYEVSQAIKDKWSGLKTDIEIERVSFYFTEKLLEKFEQSEEPKDLISKCVNSGLFVELSKKRYAQMISAFAVNDAEIRDEIVISSIEIVKGLEADKCLFILTPDLAPYLFGTKNDDNKMSHLLYVALTRSKDLLTILITKEVENSFSRETILGFFQRFDVLCK